MTVRWSSSVLVPVVILVAWSIPSAFGCTRKCDRFEYCDENSNACRNCSALCEKDEYSCYHKCQNFLFKSLRQNITTLQESVLTMKTIVVVFSAVAFVLICTALALLIKKYVHSIREFCRWRPQNKNTTTPPVAYTHENPNTKSPKTVPKNGANGPKQTSTSVSIYPETEVDHSVQTGTTSISHRYPAEDSTESYSYDNAACNVTPTSNNPMPKF